MTRFSLLHLSLALPTLASGCFEEEPPSDSGTACTEMAAASVTLTVTDEAGAAFEGASAAWSLDGEDQGACDDLGGGLFNCGYEANGEITVTVTAEGYETVEQSVVVESDGCHVIGHPLAIEMIASEAVCNEMAAASIQATLLGASAEELDGAIVRYRDAMIDDTPWIDCEPIDGVWVCGWEIVGTFDVMGTAGGHTEDYALVEVALDADGCHPVTQDVTLQVEWLPD